MLRISKALLLCIDEVERQTLRHMLVPQVELTWVHCLTELKEKIGKGRCGVLFCGGSFHRSRWKDAMGEIRFLAGALPVIFLCQAEGLKECQEVFDAGGVGMLASSSSRLSFVRPTLPSSRTDKFAALQRLVSNLFI